MTAYRPAMDQLRARRKGKPGELLLMIGVLLMVVAPMLLAIVHGEGDEYTALKAQGVVAEAQILAHASREQGYTDRKGRSRSRTIHIITLQYDMNAALPFADWQAAGTIVPSPYPAVTTAEIEVAASYFTTHPVGATRPVALLQGDPRSLELVERIEYETSARYFLTYYLAAAALLAAGAAMATVGWRRRQAHG